MSLGAKFLVLVVALAEGAYWVWLVMDIHHGHYPVTIFGWLSLIGDPIVLVIGVAVFLSDRKYRGKDL